MKCTTELIKESNLQWKIDLPIKEVLKYQDMIIIEVIQDFNINKMMIILMVYPKNIGWVIFKINTLKTAMKINQGNIKNILKSQILNILKSISSILKILLKETNITKIKTKY